MATKAGGKKPMAIKSIPAGHDQAEKKLPSMVESGKSKGRKHKKKMRETFKCYIYRVLKQVHPDLGISIKAIGIVDCFVNDIFDKLVGEAIELSAHRKKTTITAREIQTSTKLMLPGELAKHAIFEGVKAVTIFSTE